MTDNPSRPAEKAHYRTAGAVQKPASDQDFLLNAWLHGRPVTTARCYRTDAEAFLRAVEKPLREVALSDLQAWAATLTGAPSSRSRRIAAVRSLLAFAHRLKFLPVDPGRDLRVPKSSPGAPRILTEADVQRMIGAEPDQRARVALRLLYATGVRNSELCGLRHRDVTARKKGITADVIGKGSKLRQIEIPAPLWRDVTELAPHAKPEDPLVRGRDGRSMTERALHRLVRRAAKRIGLVGVSPHWLRHAHASHALDHGCPIHVAQRQLGHASIATTGRYLHPRAGESSGAYLPQSPQ